MIVIGLAMMVALPPGGCHHRVFGKRGAFKNMRGLITFFDVIPDPGESGASNYYWAGRLRTTA